MVFIIYMGHPEKEKTLSHVRDRFFWPGMSTDIDKWFSNCDRYLRTNTSTNSRAPLVNIQSTYALEMVCMDYLSLESTKDQTPKLTHKQST